MSTATRPVVDTRPPLIAIVGPTASGKTALALHVAERFNGVVVNSDSRQVYRGMDIGTAKPSSEEQARVPHRLLDLLEPDQPFALADFQDLARAAIADVHSERRPPLLVGGTGQYTWALLEGWDVPRVTPDPTLRAYFEEVARQAGADALHARLRAVDPEMAAAIHPNNVRRVVRALEIYRATGKAPSSARRKAPPPYRNLILAVDWSREDLYRRIDARVDALLGFGWLDEVRALMDAGFSPDLPAMSSLGYREVMAHLRGEIDLERAAEQIKAETHRLARQQLTWFRRDDCRIRWLQPRTAFRQAGELVAEFLAERVPG